MGFDITVIFPYYNEEQSLGRTLELISQQTHAPKEVILLIHLQQMVAAH